MIVLEGRAAGVVTTDMSSPPETRMGAMSTTSCRLYGGGRGAYGGHMASERTSCECKRRETDWTHRQEERRTEDAELAVWRNENCVTFWSTPEVYTVVPS